MTPTPVHVVKIGGSLLDLPDLPARFRHWLQQRPAVHHVVVIGGGLLVEAVRAWHAVRPMDDSTAHWACIDLMGVNARALAAEFPEFEIRKSGHLAACGVDFLDVADFMAHVEPYAPGVKLPASWDVTSDAIAGRLAIVLGAAELVLLKSALPAANQVQNSLHLADLANQGVVDRFLPQLAGALPTTYLVNLRQVPQHQLRVGVD